ncbi:hypothetical protein SAMD00019534_013490 [Acytostelium subglobosum LB1]|uniref:hypothetical protein n=1 Tax=Acytostelium subglobosum LB1 TaxID=1410327 RepID=UPI000644BB89|nr:hypothetical protein SAMD00019534_013490 [Acytostelium subglobosum LB1]GAM18174.1 hypothetical protein SAMD00019534_013490 [Acytostelium subglobosum LB1]|eukprot:XP_012758770.1 hypothetical protein SAMD00019534_013490 [Acytostelium subglobosum LB1]
MLQSLDSAINPRTFDKLCDSRYYDVCESWFDKTFTDPEERALLDNARLIQDMMQLSICFWDLSPMTDQQIISVFADLLLVFIVDDWYKTLTEFTINAIMDNAYEDREGLTLAERLTLKLLREIRSHSVEETFGYSRSYFLEWLHMSKFEEMLCKLPKNCPDVYYRGRTSWAGASTIYITAFTSPQIKAWVDALKCHPEFSDMIMHLGAFIGVWNDMFSRKKEMNEKININVYAVVDNEEYIYNYCLSRLKQMAQCAKCLDNSMPGVQRLSDCLMGIIVWYTTCIRYTWIPLDLTVGGVANK